MNREGFYIIKYIFFIIYRFFLRIHIINPVMSIAKGIIITKIALITVTWKAVIDNSSPVIVLDSMVIPVSSLLVIILTELIK